MAGVGIRFSRLFPKNAQTTGLAGVLCSANRTVAPMLILSAALAGMRLLADFSALSYARRALFSCTVLYLFVFAMLTTAPFQAVAARYLSDAIYQKQEENVRPFYEQGRVLNLLFSSLFGIPFCLHEQLAGGVRGLTVFLSFCAYSGLVLALYAMPYLSACKAYRCITQCYAAGMLTVLALTGVLCRVLHREAVDGMLLALAVGLWVTAALEEAFIRRTFPKPEGRSAPVFASLRNFWPLAAAHTLYTLGLYLPNFVFWGTDLRMVVVNSFVCSPAYDLAACLAMFTNLSAVVLFGYRVETNFQGTYRVFSTALANGCGSEIERTKRQAFRALAGELWRLVRFQAMYSAGLYVLLLVVLPRAGVPELTVQIYSLLAAGYFILFVLACTMLFLYYFSDPRGVLGTAAVFCGATLAASFLAARLPAAWYGIGLTVGALASWCTAYLRLHWLETHLEEQLFCTGTIFPYGRGNKPPDKVFDRRAAERKEAR